MFYPSQVEQSIIEILDNWAEGINTYLESAITIIESNLRKTKLEWNIDKFFYDYDHGGCSIAWVEDGHLHTMSFEFIVD